MSKEETTNNSPTLDINPKFKKYVYYMLCDAATYTSLRYNMVRMELSQREIEYLKYLVECDMQKEKSENEKEN